MDYEFRIYSPFEVIEESKSAGVRLKGVFIKLNKPTTNGRVYPAETEGENIAETLKGAPVYWGVNPITNKHVKRDPVGRVLSAFYNKLKGVVEGTVEIFESSGLGDLLRKMKTVGFSIGGKAQDLRSIGGGLKRVVGMVCNHLQILGPEILRGQVEAQGYVTEETYSFEVEESLEDETDMAEFALKKTRLIDMARRAGMDNSKIAEMVEGITEKEDVDRVQALLNTIIIGVAENDRRQNDPNRPRTRGGGVVPLRPPEIPRSQKWVFDDVREGIDTLYSRVANGDPEAQKMLTQLWDKAIPLLKTMPDNFAVVQCARCGRGILEGETCPFCGWDSRTYLQKAGEI